MQNRKPLGSQGGEAVQQAAAPRRGQRMDRRLAQHHRLVRAGHDHAHIVRQQIARELRPLVDIVNEVMSLARRRRVVVPLGLRSYVVEVGEGWGPLVRHFERKKPNGIFRISDTNVEQAQGHDISRAFSWPQPFDVLLEPGEERKNLETLRSL